MPIEVSKLNPLRILPGVVGRQTAAGDLFLPDEPKRSIIDILFQRKTLEEKTLDERSVLERETRKTVTVGAIAVITIALFFIILKKKL